MMNRPPFMRAGSALVLTMIAIAIAFVLGIVFLGRSTTVTGIALAMNDHAHARQIAESGLAMAAQYVFETRDWRDSQTAGVWIDELPIDDGRVTVTSSFAPNANVNIDNASFELSIGELATPLLSPPMTGVIGEWTLTRTALVQTGPTVPKVGIKALAGAPDGNNVGSIEFTVSVIGSGTISQKLSASLQPHTTYELNVDAKLLNLAIGTSFAIRILAGSVVIASSDHAATLALPALPTTLPTPPPVLPLPPEQDAVLEWLGLGAGYSRYTLRFTTDESPPPGLISIECRAQTLVGIVASARFDNITLVSYQNTPLTLSAVGRYGSASHLVTAQISSDRSLLQWQDR